MRFEPKPHHISLRTTASVLEFRVNCRFCERNPRGEGKVLLRCQEELHTQVFVGALTGNTRQDSNLAKAPLTIHGQYQELLQISRRLRKKYFGSPSCMCQRVAVDVSGTFFSEFYRFCKKEPLRRLLLAPVTRYAYLPNNSYKCTFQP